jgi:hypothetical protein
VDWYLSLPPVTADVPCGNGSHTVRWESGRLSLPGHPDADAELVLAALGGARPECVTLSQTWSRHADDLLVLAAGPRSLDDRVTVTREQVEQHRAHWPRAAVGGMPGAGGMRGPARAVLASAQMARAAAMGPGLAGGVSSGEEVLMRVRRQFEVLELLALGPAFQFRLSGEVAAAWASQDRAGDRREHRPELAAALTGRFAPAAARWLGIDPGEVAVTPHEGPGWGSLAVSTAGTGSGTSGGARLRASLPVSWLSAVWACGLAVVSGHLVVAVTEPGYPRARVLALRAPGGEPAVLDVEAAAPDVEAAGPRDAAGAAGALPRWEAVTR